MTTTTTTTATTKRHPVRGFLYGIPFGLGVAMIAIGQKWAALGTWPPFILFIVGVLVATAWGTFGPAKAPKEPPPVGHSADAVAVTSTETVDEAETETAGDTDGTNGDRDLTEGDETG